MKKFDLNEGRLFLVFAVLYLLLIFILFKGLTFILAGFSFIFGGIIVYLYFNRLRKKI